MNCSECRKEINLITNIEHYHNEDDEGILVGWHIYHEGSGCVAVLGSSKAKELGLIDKDSVININKKIEKEKEKQAGEKK